MEALVGLQHGFLGQVFGVEVITAQSQRMAIQRLAQRNDLTFEPRNQLTIVWSPLGRFSTSRRAGVLLGHGHPSKNVVGMGMNNVGGVVSRCLPRCSDRWLRR